MVSQRRLSRIAAVQALFSVSFRKNADIKHDLLYCVSQLPEKLESSDFALTLAEGAYKKTSYIDEMIQKHAHDDNFEKIDALTLSILYVSIFELCLSKDKQPAPVIINEAVEIAKEYAKESSPALINALLSKIQNAK